MGGIFQKFMKTSIMQNCKDFIFFCNKIYLSLNFIVREMSEVLWYYMLKPTCVLLFSSFICLLVGSALGSATLSVQSF